MLNSSAYTASSPAALVRLRDSTGRVMDSRSCSADAGRLAREDLVGERDPRLHHCDLLLRTDAGVAAPQQLQTHLLGGSPHVVDERLDGPQRRAGVGLRRG